MEFLKIFGLLILIAGLVAIALKFWKDARECSKSRSEIELRLEELIEVKSKLTKQNKSLNEYADWLRPFSELPDADRYVERRTLEGDELVKSSKAEANRILIAAKQDKERIIIDAKAEAKRIRERHKESQLEAERVLSYAHSQAKRTVDGARDKAVEIAGKAYYALENVERLEATASAMSDIINGYGDRYLIDTESWVDSLAEEWGHKEAGRELKSVRIRIKQMTEGKSAAECEYVDVNRKETALSFVIDAFNGKVDSILAKTRHDNYGTLSKQLRDSFQIVNHLGAAFRNTRITEEYLNYRISELYWAVGTKELQKRAREEQAEIKREMREEERARKEYERAIKQAEKEEDMLNRALEKARAEMQKANDQERRFLESQLFDIEEKLREAEEKNQRALSMAQQTKRGHVYIISNIGSFGDNVFKIGMTRRLEPMDRVKELGDASVPFRFDVHALIYCEDAPRLEAELHKFFENRRVNRVNHRKEFFRASLSEIREIMNQQGIEDVRWTLEAEALEYRETLALSRGEAE